MVDLSKRWPAGLGTRLWWVPVVAALAVLVVALALDRQVSVWGRGMSEPFLGFFDWLTRYGESDWILIPSGILLAITAPLAFAMRWKLMRTMLWQFSSLYGFIFLGVGVPSLVSTLVKRALGRGRPDHFDEFGLLHFQPNWLDWSFQSFPSGHATTAFALAAVLAFMAPRWTVLWALFAVMVAVSRVVLGMHYPSDVIAGAILGVTGAYAIRLVFATRGWTFRLRPDGSIRYRPMSSLRRYLALKQRDIARAPLQDQP
jgi:membrane-associated phospholipid phosphatase